MRLSALKARHHRMPGAVLLQKSRSLSPKRLSRQKLSSLSGDELVSALASLALRAADGESGELVLAEKDASLKEKILAKCSENKGITVSKETHSLGGGLIFKRGNTEINCTFSRLAHELREELQLEIAEILFG